MTITCGQNVTHKHTLFRCGISIVLVPLSEQEIPQFFFQVWSMALFEIQNVPLLLARLHYKTSGAACIQASAFFTEDKLVDFLITN